MFSFLEMLNAPQPSLNVSDVRTICAYNYRQCMSLICRLALDWTFHSPLADVCEKVCLVEEEDDAGVEEDSAVGNHVEQLKDKMIFLFIMNKYVKDPDLDNQKLNK